MKKKSKTIVIKKKSGGQVKATREKITPKVLEMAGRYGLRNDDISSLFGISTACFKEFLRRNPDLLATLKDAKGQADSEVEASLYLQALGYTIKEVKTAYNAVLDKWSQFEVDVHVKPNAVATIFWLKNRQPAKWRELQEFAGKFEGNVQHTHLIKPEDVTDEHKRRVVSNLGILQRYGTLGSGVSQN